MRETLAAGRHFEEAVLGAEWTEGIVLRYGAFYGPGTSMAPGEEQFELVRKRRFPLVGDGGGVWSFIHVADAAEATVAAIERGSRGVYNVVDDDPAPVAQWLPALARELGGKKPMRVPPLVGRLFTGEAGLEPIVTDDLDDPAQQAEMADSLSMAMLVLLESLSPEQRAAPLLHDVFDYSYADIATIVGKSEPAVRQLASRARPHVKRRRPAFRRRVSSATSWRGGSSPPPKRAISPASKPCWLTTSS